MNFLLGFPLLVIVTAPAFATTSEPIEIYKDGRTLTVEDVKQLSELEDDNGSLEANFRVVNFNEHLSSPKNVARYMWKNLVGAWTTEPKPCGYQLYGNITERGYTMADGVKVYEIKGHGDGGRDSCIGTAGPGYWSYRVVIRMAGELEQGTVEYKWATE